MSIEENVALAKLTSLHVGGPARWLVRATSDDDVLEGLEFAQEKELPVFVLGKGSNTLFPDAGWPGVVIHMEDRTIAVAGAQLTAASGVFMRSLVTAALEAGLRGLEELAGIPGTVGGAVRGNAGTWDTEVKDVLVSVEVFKPTVDGVGWSKQQLSNEECGFGYRHSTFKQQSDWVILRAVFGLKKGDVVEGEALVAKDLQQRHERQPYDAPSAGSIFKNPDKDQGIFSGALIEAAGLKGTQQGGAEISPKHANFIVNRGGATSADIRALIQLAQERVEEMVGVVLEPEIVVVPEP